MSNTVTAPAPPQHPLVAALENLRTSEDRGALATLRRGLADVNNDFGLYRIIGRTIPRDESDWGDTCYRLVACLYAAHQMHDGRLASLGASTHQLRNRLGDGASSLDIRFTALLNADAEDLPVRLRHLFSQLTSQDVPVNYNLLLGHLKAWHATRRSTQRTWARDYWAAEPDETRKPDAAQP